MKYLKVLSLILVLHTGMSYGMEEGSGPIVEGGMEDFRNAVQYFMNYIKNIDKAAANYSEEQWKSLFTKLAYKWNSYTELFNAGESGALKEAYNEYVRREEKIIRNLSKLKMALARLDRQILNPYTEEEWEKFTESGKKEITTGLEGLPKYEESKKRLFEERFQASNKYQRAKKTLDAFIKSAVELSGESGKFSSEVKKKYDKLNENLEEANKELVNSTKKYSELEAEKDALQMNANELQRKLDEKEAALKEKEDALKEAQRAFDVFKESKKSEKEREKDKFSNIYNQAKDDLNSAKQDVAEAEGEAAGLNLALIKHGGTKEIQSRTIRAIYDGIKANYPVVKESLERANEAMREWFANGTKPIQDLTEKLREILEDKSFTEATKQLYNQFYAAYKLPDNDVKWEEIYDNYKEDLKYLLAYLKAVEDGLIQLTKLPMGQPDKTNLDAYNGYNRVVNYLKGIEYARLQPSEGSGLRWTTGEYLTEAIKRLEKALQLK